MRPSGRSTTRLPTRRSLISIGGSRSSALGRRAGRGIPFERMPKKRRAAKALRYRPGSQVEQLARPLGQSAGRAKGIMDCDAAQSVATRKVLGQDQRAAGFSGGCYQERVPIGGASRRSIGESDADGGDRRGDRGEQGEPIAD